jgi:hypothetical protein
MGKHLEITFVYDTSLFEPYLASKAQQGKQSLSILYKSHRPLFYSIQVSSTLVLFYTSLLSLAFSASKQSLLSLGKTLPLLFYCVIQKLKGFILRVGYKEEQAWPSLPLLDSSLLILTKQAKGVLVFSSKVVNAGKRQHTIKKKRKGNR